ncbi:hypothetical protein K7711_43810 [Nocardia sp. CA2R105]|uniref:hypothetical protein n=1 Tax=Nocardia coffeae TaxID=2873381 RepID=UPI001CA6BC0E|nr:hypothetical protein [Nocardia coffeae]MBY8863459.1 hypothetical protein [Nocardia coffeae]
MSEKDYLELMRDLAAFRRTRVATTDPASGHRLDHAIEEHDAEIRRRDRHGR